MSFDQDGHNGFLLSFVMYACHSLKRQTRNNLQQFVFSSDLIQKYNLDLQN